MIKEVKVISLITFLLFAFNIFGANEFVKNEVIVQFSEKLSAKEVDNYLNKNLTNVEVKVKHRLSERLKIWLLTVTESDQENAVISALNNSYMVNIAQLNHKVELRQTFPDDEHFDNKWDLHNDGSYGTEDSDIDAPEAWDITTGGVTALGDTIVVAVVDGGSNLNHPDLDHWKNTAEIPNNNIDDDNNGYIDDYDGWNGYSNSGNIPTHSHGTHVSGIVGAIGNNGIGVTGVNWNCKIMPLAGDSANESIVINAYGYVLEMRARYNETNGEEGAFVVAMNSSFGVNQGDPEDYPLWSAIYDSLGNQGVLSPCATANANWNIDEVLDMPTACESEYMIGVTNTNGDDQKYGSAGYGAETIDLGAPGTHIYSTQAPGTGYTYKTGTSMSTPQVSGAIALLYAAAPEQFISEYRDDPAGKAIQLRNYIYDSVDPIESLNGVTVTGGRLNVFNAINLMLDDYSNTSNHITEDTTWDTNQTIDETIIIDANVTLTITPGTTIQFANGAGLTIRGNINATGTRENPISFTAQDTTGFSDLETENGGWEGLSFESCATSGSSVLTFCNFKYAKNVTTTSHGGAITMKRIENVDISNCIFENNISKNGGALHVNPTNPNLDFILYHNSFNNNFSTDKGADIYLEGINGLMIANALHTNDLANNKELVNIDADSVMIINSTVFTTDGLQLRSDKGAWLLQNNIFWSNNASQILKFNGSDNEIYGMIQNCNLYLGVNGISTSGSVNFYDDSVISEDPQFEIDFGVFPFMIGENSPCINAGTPELNEFTPDVDLVGNTRVYAGRIDMGAYERQSVDISDENVNQAITSKVYPNPLIINKNRSVATIQFSISKVDLVNVSIYNTKGQLVRKLVKDKFSAGLHKINWNGKSDSNESVASGIYMIRINSSTQVKTQKLLLMK
jgi:subtilisin family serine protease